MSRTRFLLILVTFAAFACCVVGALAAFTVIPGQAELIFGPPTPALGPLQRFTLSYNLLNHADILTAPAKIPGEEVSFVIEPGDSANAIIQRLADAGLIVDAEGFRDYLIYTGIDTRLKPGQFRLSTAMTHLEIAAAIEGFSATEAALTILPGWRLEEVAAAIPTSGLEIGAETFLRAVQGRPQGFTFTNELPEQITHEGFLFPGTYTFPRTASELEVVEVFLASFEKNITAEIRAGFLQQGVSLYEAVILASIVEREAVVDGEQGLIASVYFNRLRQGMLLQADPTVQYALGYNEAWGWWKSPLALQDLSVESFYNTYLYNSLPPAPIASPGIEALNAVAFPAETDYFFFRAACDGSGRHLFAISFEEHQANACP
ncbi:MAG: endolytic transglycosylase MltG [Anaerolineales bacterium]